MAEEDKRGGLRSILRKLGKGKFKEAKEDIDESIYSNIVEPAAKEGKDTRARSTVAAGLSAASDFLLPDDSSDVIASAFPPAKIVKKGSKAVRLINRKSGKAGKAAVKSKVARETDALKQERRELIRQGLDRNNRTPEQMERLKELEELLSPNTLDYGKMKK